MPADSRSSIVTPEAVSVEVESAGLGSRMIAALIDFVIQGVVFFALLLAFGFTSAIVGEAVGWIFLLLVFLILFGYFIIFEILWAGQTPGKRVQKLRVVQKNGQPARATHILVRNIVRIVDYLPSGYGVGVLTMLFTRSRRLGDLAAGTIVIKEVKAPVPSALPRVSTASNEMTSKLDVSAITQEEYGVVRTFLGRRATLDTHARAILARDLAERLRTKVPGAPSLQEGNEPFLEAAAQAFRDRHSG